MESEGLGGTPGLELDRATSLLAPFLPRIVVDWLRREPTTRYRAIPATAVFADISGFTNLTERLAARGKAGAEEIREILNGIFEDLFQAAYRYDANLIKWGGDAMLLHFDGDGHTARACRASADMQRVMRGIGRVQTSAGVNQLRMSMGIHRGDYEFLLLGDRHRELAITGPSATEVTRMEKCADAGEIVVSGATAAYLEAHEGLPRLRAKGPGFLLSAVPAALPVDVSLTDFSGVALATAFSPAVRDYLLSGVMEVEHRHAAVAFVRMSGTDDIAQNEGPDSLVDAVGAFVVACQDAATRHQVAYLATDVTADGVTVILTAGVPGGVGDDESRLLSAVRAIVDAAGRRSVHAGVNAGRLVTGEFGPSYRRTYSVMGDCVNLAARLMAQAGPGEVVATSIVIDRSRTHFDVTALPPFKVKGKAGLIDAVLVGPVSPASRPTSEADLPLFGREQELHQLEGAFATAVRGTGRVVEIIGAAGVGKSRLLQECIRRVGAKVVWAEGDVYSASTPYAPFHDVFEKCAGPDGLQSRLEGAPELEPWLPLIGIAANIEFAMTPAVAALDPGSLSHRLQAAASQALAELLPEPTVLVFNDLHFMDEASRELVARLSADLVARPWLILVTRRELEPGEQTIAGAVQMPLLPLGVEAAAAYLDAATAGAPLLPHRRAELLHRAAGNPLFLGELVASRGVLDDGELPETVEKVLAARIDRLDPRQRTLLRTIAVLGMRVETRIVDRVLDLDAGAGNTSSVHWQSLDGFVEPDGPDAIRFAHDLIRVVAYEGLSFRRRTALHGHAASAILEQVADPATVADRLSLHTFYGERFADAWSYARLAGDQAKAAFAVSEAATFYRRALAAADRVRTLGAVQEVEVCEGLADCVDALGEFEEGDAVLRRARRLCSDDPVRLAGLQMKTAICRERTGQPSEARRWLSRGLSTLASVDTDSANRVKADLMARYTRVVATQGRYRDAVRWAERGITAARAAGHRVAEARSLEYLDWAETALGVVRPEWPATRALELYVELDDFLGQGHANNTLGARCYYLGRWPNALGHYAAAEVAYRRCGFEWCVGVPMASRAEIRFDQGHLDDAEASLLAALDILRAAQQESDLGWATYLLGRVRARKGDGAGADTLFKTSRERFEALGSRYDLFAIDAYHAEARLFAGAPAEAIRHVDGALARLPQVEGAEAFEPLLRRVRGLAGAELGGHDGPRQDLIACVEAAVRRGAVHEEAFGLRALLDRDLATEAERLEWLSRYQHLARGLELV